MLVICDYPSKENSSGNLLGEPSKPFSLGNPDLAGSLFLMHDCLRMSMYEHSGMAMIGHVPC